MDDAHLTSDHAGLPTILPAEGSAHAQVEGPGEWHRWILSHLPKFDGDDLQQMSVMPGQRDIVLRRTRKWDNLIFCRELDNERHIRGAMAYTVGNVAPTTCNLCSRRPIPYGPFPQCVVVKGLFGGACANCVWDGFERKCRWGTFSHAG